MIKISEVEQAFKDIFEEEKGKVQSVETVYEKSEDEKFLKLIIAIHGLSSEDVLIVHTKFIFKTDLEKHNILEDRLIYLYDINCVYHSIEFSNIIDMKKKIEDVIESNNFGTDLQILSDFCESPSLFLNYYMKKAKITDYSIFDVEYSPKFKMVPCSQTSFDFKINISNNYNISLSITKKDRKEDEETDTYKFQFKLLDEYTTFETASLLNVHYFIGSSIAKILDEKLK